MAAAQSQPKLLPQAVREKLRAIVFDTNSFPRGGLRLSTLKEWERRAGLADLEIWLPEPVVWELAEHAASSWDEYQAITKTAGKALSYAGLEVHTSSPHGSRAEVIKAVEEAIRSLGPALRVLELDGDVAIAALKDQILQRKPAKSRDGVKTGASDSAWLRQVLKTAGGDPHTFVIVGGDRDVYKAFEEWNLEKPSMVSLEDLQEALFVLDEPDTSVVEKIATFLRGLVGSPLDGGRTRDGTLTIGEISGPADLVDDWLTDQVHDVSLVHLEAFAGLNQIKIDRLTGVVSAQVFLCPKVEYSSWTLDPDGTARTHSGSVPGVVVRDVLSFTIEDGTVVRAESQSGLAAAFGGQKRGFDESDEAFNELLDALTLVPEIGVDPELSGTITDLEVGGERTISFGDHALTVTSEGSDEGWATTLTLSNGARSKSLELRCEWDPTKNPHEMPDLFPAWVVFTESEVSYRAPGLWAAPVWVIENLMPEEQPSAPWSP
ncbi:hypothetical protein QFZ22_000169 [Streptomyces canus]|uniref:DUF4935 domain-containing protein n=1 Tax=Streptomyces canus TaxID=58343 RepID=A0AAW8F341_9ACTN|nr:hypothetical protein [Streptomyces canus]MDQ0904184.1 hypothetical protein [Streptomyces canus]